MYEPGWTTKTWTIDHIEGDLGLAENDILSFGDDGSQIKVHRGTDEFFWGEGCTYASETEAHVDYLSVTYRITQDQDLLTCSPKSASSEGDLAYKIATVASGTLVGSAVGYLLDDPIFAALAGATTAVVTDYLLEKLEGDSVPNGEDPPSSWTALGGTSGGPGGTAPNPQEVPVPA